MYTKDEILGAVRSVLDNVEWRDTYSLINRPGRPKYNRKDPEPLMPLTFGGEEVALEALVQALDGDALLHLEAAIKARRAEPPISGPTIEHV